MVGVGEGGVVVESFEHVALVVGRVAREAGSEGRLEQLDGLWEVSVGGCLVVEHVVVVA